MTPAERLERLARSWRRRRLAAFVAVASAAALLAGVVAWRVGGTSPIAAVAAATLAGIGCALVAAAATRRTPVTAREVAEHLDRMHPPLEYSTTLLLEQPASLPPLERLQRERVAAAFDALAPAPLPNRPLRRGAAAAGVALIACAGVLMAGRMAPAGPLEAEPRLILAPVSGTAPDAPSLRPVELVIDPPAYTGRPRRHAAALDAEAETGARVTWRLAADQAGAVLFVTADGDTVPFAGSSATVVATRPLLYQLVVRGAGGATAATELHQLTVRPDRPPVITIVSPPPRTILAPGEPLQLAVRATADDEYGVGTAELVATITTGRGEAVRFREERLAFSRRRVRGTGADFAVSLDLARLGLAPGDELYFHVRATDRRSPVANESRSPTHFVSLLDTAAIADADFGGLPVSRLPEYFRSQRQIIIDTERLLAEAPRLAAGPFADRSNGIGMDQGLLRTRYGAIVGDETEGGTGDPAEGHDHDSEENATLLAASVKSTLRAALGEMWQAELKLRTGDPRAALPHEYAALEHLKAVQQAGRAYVQRAGVESPPLEPDAKRLTGDRRGIADRRMTATIQAADPDAALRSALPVLGALAAGAPPAADDRTVLGAAADRLVELAASDPGVHLGTIRLLRRVTDSLARGTACAACADSAAGAIARVLPVPARVPGRGAEAAGGGVARRYFDELNR